MIMYIYQMHIPHAYTLYMYHIHVPYIYHMHIPYTFTMYMHHVHAPCTCTMYMYHVHVPCTKYMYHRKSIKGAFRGLIWASSGLHLGFIWDWSGLDLGFIWASSGIGSRLFYGCFKVVSNGFPNIFRFFFEDVWSHSQIFSLIFFHVLRPCNSAYFAIFENNIILVLGGKSYVQ